MDTALRIPEGEPPSLVLAPAMLYELARGQAAGKVRGRWIYLYRAVDRHGDIIGFHLSPARSAKAARRLLARVLRRLRASERPVVINIDEAPAYGAATTALEKERTLNPCTQHRQVRHFNNRPEADHGKLKRPIKPTLGFQSLRTAFATLKKGQGALFRYFPDKAGEVDLVHRAFGLV